MIHLFNKIYLKGDHLFKLERDRIVISPTYGVAEPVPSKFAHNVNDVEQGKVYGQAATYTELIKKVYGGDEQKFFKFLLNYDPSKRLTIYADLPTMWHIATKFYKTVFPYMTADTYIKVMKCVLLRVNYLYGAGKLPFTDIPQPQALDFRLNAMHLLEDIEGWRNVWATTTPWRMMKADRTIITRGASIEFKLATHFATPTWAGRRAFEQQLVRMTQKRMINEFIFDVKHVILSNFFALKMYEPTANFDPFVNTVEDFIKQFPQYKFLTDDKFHPDQPEYVWNTYNMDDLKYAFKKVRMVPMELGVDYSPLLDKNLSIDKILASGGIRFVLSANDYREHVNSYLLDFVLDGMKTDLEELEQLALK